MFERLGQRLAGSVLIWDLILTLVCLDLAARLRVGLAFGKPLTWTQAEMPWQVFVAVWVIWTVVFFLLWPQRAIFTRPLLEAIGRLVATVGLGALIFAGLLYLTLRDISRLQYGYFVAINLTVLLVFHLLIRSYLSLRNRSGWERRVLLVGGGEASSQLVQEFARRPWADVRIVGYTSDTPSPSPIGIPLLGTLDQTPQLVEQLAIQEVVFTLPSDQYAQIARLSLQLQQYPVMVHMVPGVLDLAFARTSVQELGGIPLISLRESVLTEPQRMFKRVFDVLASLFLLVMLAPLMIIIAILIKRESPGPVFFLQERIGENGRHFKMIKFRSMYQDADRRWHEVARRDESGKLQHKQRDDPRITRVGRILRRTSLDELPQLFNVLIGEMSLVGPRPEMPYIAREYEPWQWQRFRVPPGMTGWWQINGRSDKPMHLNTEEDLYYIQNYSFWLDLTILLKTVAVVVRGRGAY